MGALSQHRRQLKASSYGFKGRWVLDFMVQYFTMMAGHCYGLWRRRCSTCGGRGERRRGEIERFLPRSPLPFSTLHCYSRRRGRGDERVFHLALLQGTNTPTNGIVPYMISCPGVHPKKDICISILPIEVHKPPNVDKKC